MRARELAAWSAANTLADAVRVAIERLDGPASVRNPAEALDILQTALGIAQPALDVAADRGTEPIAPLAWDGRSPLTVVAYGTPLRGASS